MRVRWGIVMLPAVVLSVGLLAASQLVFLRTSFFRDRGFGLVDAQPTLGNYLAIATDAFYLNSLYLTVQVALIVVACSLLMGYPVAYVLTRMPARWATLIIAAIVASALVAEVIKVLGLIVIFSADGIVNRTLVALGAASAPIKILGSITGVVVGLLHFTLGFVILLLFSVLQTIPRSLEEAAGVHGASPLRVFWRVVLPLSAPGVITAGLVIFNLSMGAFTAVSLLGGGRILTLPVLIERTMILETKYGMAASLSAVLLGTVLLINALAALAVSRSRFARAGSSPA
jgi:putative spermidine/putrescine transport system permease protein